MSLTIQTNSTNTIFNRFKPQANKALFKSLFAHVFLPNIPKPAISGITSNSIFCASDYTTFYRAGFDLVNNSLSSVHSNMAPALGGTDFGLSYQLYGVSSGLSAFVAVNGMKQDFASIARYDALNDKGASLMGRVSFAKHAALLGGSTAFGVFRPLAVAAEILKSSVSIQSTTLVGRIAYGVQFAGLALFALFCALGSIVLGINLYQEIKMANKLSKCESLTEQVAFLQNRLKVNPEKVFDKLVKKHGGDQDKAINALIEEAYTSGKERMKEVLKGSGGEKLDDTEMRELIKGAVMFGLEELNGGADQSEVVKKIHASTTQTIEAKLLAIVGLQMMVEKTELKKENKMKRVLTTGGFEALQELAKLPGEIRPLNEGEDASVQDTEIAEMQSTATHLVEKIKTSNLNAIKREALWLSVFALGVVTLVLLAVFTGGTSLLVASVLMMLFSIGFVAIDVSCLVKSYKNETPLAQHDKKVLWTSTALAAVSLLLFTALSASGVVSMGTVPLIIGIVIGLIWLAQNIATLAVASRNERIYQGKNPTLEILLKAIDDQEDRTRITKMFENLPKEEKMLLEEILNKGAEAQNDLERILQFVMPKQVEPKPLERKDVVEAIQKSEKIKEKNLAFLRQSLSNLSDSLQNKEISYPSLNGFVA